MSGGPGAGLRPAPAAAVGAASLLAFLAAWEAAVRGGLVDPFFLPPPSRVLREAVQMAVGPRAVLGADVAVSARRVLTGFALAALAGVPLGLFLGASPWARAAANPLLSVIRPLPALSWIPLSILWLGIGEAQKYAIVFMGCFASVLVYTIDATRSVDPALLRAARNLGAGRWQVLGLVMLPAALPQVLSGLKVVLAIAWTCVISAEMVGAARGLGYRIWSAKEFSDTGQILVGMLSISATVLVLDVAFRGLERLLVPWRREAGR